MVQPDRVFMKRLKEIDKKLGCQWFPHLEKFMLTYKRPVGEPVAFRLIESETGEFRQPDQREIDWLMEHDSQRVSHKEQLNEISRKAEEYKAKMEKERKDRIHETTLDNKYQITNLHNLSQGIAKGHKHVRRIEPKTKGYTVRDLRKINNTTGSNKEK